MTTPITRKPQQPGPSRFIPSSPLKGKDGHRIAQFFQQVSQKFRDINKKSTLTTSPVGVLSSTATDEALEQIRGIRMDQNLKKWTLENNENNTPFEPNSVPLSHKQTHGPIKDNSAGLDESLKTWRIEDQKPSNQVPVPEMTDEEAAALIKAGQGIQKRTQELTPSTSRRRPFQIDTPFSDDKAIDEIHAQGRALRGLLNGGVKRICEFSEPLPADTLRGKKCFPLILETFEKEVSEEVTSTLAPALEASEDPSEEEVISTLAPALEASEDPKPILTKSQKIKIMLAANKTSLLLSGIAIAGLGFAAYRIFRSGSQSAQISSLPQAETIAPIIVAPIAASKPQGLLNVLYGNAQAFISETLKEAGQKG